jgi:hypothetical protein
MSMPPMSSFQSKQNKKQNKQTAKLNKKLSKQLRPALAKRSQQRKLANFRSMPAGPQSNLSGGTGRLGLGGASNRSTNRRMQVIEEDEYIGDISGSVAFATTQFSANPGQAGTFAWGSKIAALYQKYDFEMLEFYYKREVSEFATNGSAGKVILSFDYDASDAAPTTKQQVEDTVPHVDGMPCTPLLRLAIDCAQMRNQASRFVRSGAQPANTDIKTYDAGNFFISTYGNTNSTTIGELHVRYRVRFSAPVLEAPGSSNQSGAFALFASVTAGETASSINYHLKLADAILNPISAVNTAGSIVLPAGAYLIESAVTDTTNVNAYVGVAIAGTLVANGIGSPNAPGYSTASWITSSASPITVTVVVNGATTSDVVHGWTRITFLQAAVLAAVLPPVESDCDDLASLRSELDEIRSLLQIRKRKLNVVLPESHERDRGDDFEMFEDDPLGSSVAASSSPPLRRDQNGSIIGALIARKSLLATRG